MDHCRASERPAERWDDDSSRQIVPTWERFRNGRRGVPRTSMRSLRQADSGTPERFTRTGTDFCPGGGYQGEGPNVGWQKSHGVLEKNRERGQAYACRARVPLHGDWAMPRGGYQEHVGDTPENLTTTMPATDLGQGDPPTRRSTTEWDVRGGGRGRGADLRT